jgi:uncharacterized protein DUF2059
MPRLVAWTPSPDPLPLILKAPRRSYPYVSESDCAEVERAGREVADPNRRMVALYDRLYTADELHQIVTFFHTPADRKLLLIDGETTAERIVGKDEYALEVSKVMEGMLRDRGYERAPIAPLAPPPADAVTSQGDGRVFRPKVVQPSR